MGQRRDARAGRRYRFVGRITDSIGYASSVTPFSAEGLKIAVEELVSEAGGQVLYHAMLADARALPSRAPPIAPARQRQLELDDALPASIAGVVSGFA